MWHGPISHFGMGFCCMEPTAAIVPTASNALDQCNPSDKALACSCSESEEPHAARFMRPSFSASRGRARVRFSHAGVTVYIVCDLRCEFGEGLSLQNARAGRYKKGDSKVQKVPVVLEYRARRRKKGTGTGTRRVCSRCFYTLPNDGSRARHC